MLPASKGTAAGGDGPPFSKVADPTALAVARALAAATADLDGDDLARLTQTPASQLDEVRRLDAAVLGGSTLPAWRRYTGVVHAAADPGGLDGASRARFRRHVAYLSALAGLVPADGPLPAYRLPMGANLPPLGPLATHWRPQVVAALAALVAPGGLVWLLAGSEYERAVEVPQGLHAVEVGFVESRGGRQGSPPSAAVKQARGLLARRLATAPGAGQRPDGPAWEGFTFVAGLRDFRLEHADRHSQTWRATAT